MYSVFFGSDRTAARNAVTEYLDKNMPEDATLTSIEARDYLPGQILDSLGASSLFGGVEWFVFDGPSEKVEFFEEVKTSLKEMSESSNVFIVLEGVLLAPVKKAYAKHSSEVHEYASEKADRFNSFSLAEALADKDKRRLWVLLQEAKLSGLRPEEIIGMLWWQMKALRLAALTSSASEAGMKDFPYSKAKRALSKFAVGEVETLAQSLLELYHDGHAGVRDMELALEEWSLKL